MCLVLSARKSPRFCMTDFLKTPFIQIVVIRQKQKFFIYILTAFAPVLRHFISLYKVLNFKTAHENSHKQRVARAIPNLWASVAEGGVA
jgi:hypothetical protein